MSDDRTWGDIWSEIFASPPAPTVATPYSVGASLRYREHWEFHDLERFRVSFMQIPFIPFSELDDRPCSGRDRQGSPGRRGKRLIKSSKCEPPRPAET